MLLSFIVACASSLGGANLGSGGDRFDANGYVPDTGSSTTTDTGTTTDTDTTTTSGVTSEPQLRELDLAWGTDAESGSYLDATVTYYDSPDDVMGGTCYLTVEQGGDTLASNETFEIVEPAGWDPPDGEAENDVDASTVRVRLFGVDTTVDADASVVLKDAAGHLSTEIADTITGEEATTK